MSQNKITSKSDKFNSPLLSVVFNLREMRNQEKDYIMGKILTLLDGIIVEERQNKAVKDLARSIFWEKNYYWDEMEEMLGQFKDKFCSKVEEEFMHKVERETKGMSKNWFVSYN